MVPYFLPTYLSIHLRRGAGWATAAIVRELEMELAVVQVVSNPSNPSGWNGYLSYTITLTLEP